MEQTILTTEVSQLLIKIEQNPSEELIDELKELLIKNEKSTQIELEMLRSEVNRLSSL